MPDYSTAQKTEISDFEHQQQFLLESKGEIVHVLNDLSRKPDIITGYFDAGNRYVLTAVLKVLPERGLVVLDQGPDSAGNERLLQKGELLCITKHNRIHIKFKLRGIKKARFQGESVFAAPLPDSVFRLQRREFFRIRTPIANPVTCEIPDVVAPRQLKVLDIGYGGLALEVLEADEQWEPGQTFPDCVLNLPEFGKVNLTLEVRNIVPQRFRDGTEYRRVGCQFVQLPLDRSATIQRYIHRLQVEQKDFGQG